MLISFSLENWASFRDATHFSMVASREKQHGERIAQVSKYPLRVLPVAAIYGGNASGKTNFFKALNFVKSQVVRGTQPDRLIPVDQFLLGKQHSSESTSFSFELLIDEMIYAFSFRLTRKEILEEKLVRVTSSSEKLLYHRLDGKMLFGAGFDRDTFLDFAFKGTRDNQLFLTNSVSQKVETFRPVYDWFNTCLELVAPDSRFEPFEQFLDQDNALYNRMNTLLPMLDTGIAHLGAEEIPFENIPFPDSLKKLLQEEVSESRSVRVVSDPYSDRFVISRRQGELIAKKLVTYHTREDGSESKFELHQEADGSQRVIDVLPAFLDITAERSKKVFIIDELDRSLHTLLTRRLLESYLDSCSAHCRSQLLFTTHDVLLMDQHLLRRDEMWIAEREQNGASTLRSFSDYKDVRFDKDIRKSYLQGRMGGIPRMLASEALFSDSSEHPDEEGR
ncbi:MAG: abortive phage resistance protein [Prosthecochloris sp.]|nr:abortive phage resistance protein [Prosthecochloris sp.]